jgi:hypothetical protein
MRKMMMAMSSESRPIERTVILDWLIEEGTNCKW